MMSDKSEPVSGTDAVSLPTNPPQPGYLKAILTVSKISVGIALLVLSIRGILWENLSAGIRSTQTTWLVLAVLTVLLGLFLKIYRWAILVKNYQVPFNFSQLSRAYFIGQAVNILLPLRGGELVRMGILTRESKNTPQIASTIVLEKYLDLLALTISGILVALNFSQDSHINLRSWLLPLTTISTLSLLVVSIFGPAIWKRTRTINLLPPRLVGWIDRWVQTSLWLRDPRKMLPMLVLTVLIWGVMWITNLLLFKALNLQLGGIAAGLVLVLVYAGLLPALMPGNIGPFYFFASIALVPFGVIRDQAFVFAVILHFIVTLPPLLGGAVGLLISPRHGVNL